MGLIWTIWFQLFFDLPIEPYSYPNPTLTSSYSKTANLTFQKLKKIIFKRYHLKKIQFRVPTPALTRYFHMIWYAWERKAINSNKRTRKIWKTYTQKKGMCVSSTWALMRITQMKWAIPWNEIRFIPLW